MKVYPQQEKEPVRTERFAHNERLNELIGELKRLLLPVQEEMNTNDSVPQFPVGLVIGPPRSGTTLLMQFLASSGAFSYPTNLLARFAYAPYVGALIQKMLFDPAYDYQGEFSELRGEVKFSSDLGKSCGALAVNEFFHFWRNYMEKGFPEPFSAEEFDQINFGALSGALASLERVFERPFCTKGMLQQFNLAEFFSRQPYLFFYRMVRDPLFICQSLLTARERFYGDRNVWWSVKPAEYVSLQNMGVYHQIAGQVYFTEQAIDRGVASIPEERQITIQYDEFCANPEAIYRSIVDRYAGLDISLPTNYSGPSAFVSTNKLRIEPKDFEGLRLAYSDFVDGRVKMT